MKTKSVDVSIIVPCRNEEKYIKKIIHRIINQKGAGTLFSFELLIIDGKSEDNTINLIKEKIEENVNIKLITNEKRITPAAFNLGIKEASGKYICILGAHAEIAEDYIINCLTTIKKIGAENVGGPWIAEGQNYIGKAIAIAFQSPFATGGAKGHRVKYEGYVDTVWGGFYKREVFDNIGLFDEELVRNQDDELNYRLVKSGGRIWQTPSIRYSYYCRNSIKLLFLQYVQYGYWKVRVIQKHRLPASIRHLVPGIFVSTLILFTLLSFFSTLFLKVLVGTILLYIIAILILGFFTSKGIKNIKFWPALTIIFPTFHFGYGLGFLKGILDFLVMKKHLRKRIKDVQLTR